MAPGTQARLRRQRFLFLVSCRYLLQNGNRSALPLGENSLAYACNPYAALGGGIRVLSECRLLATPSGFLKLEERQLCPKADSVLVRPNRQSVILNGHSAPNLSEN